MNFSLTIIAQALSFALFTWFCVKFVWPWLLGKIEERQKTIADGLAEAERGHASLAEAHKQTEAMMREARTRAQEIMAQAEHTATQRMEEARAEARAEGERLVSSAKAQIDQEVQSAKQQLRDQVAKLAVSGAEKILRREVDAGAHAAMLDQLKTQL